MGDFKMRELRRKDRAVTDTEAADLLEKGAYGVLSTVGEDGRPYGVPLHYCVIDGLLYFHCALEGQKIDHITHNKSVSFCVVGKTEILPHKFATRYESVILSGQAEEVFENQKQKALEGLVKKYSADYIEKGLKYIEAFKDKARVFAVRIDQITGKSS